MAPRTGRGKRLPGRQSGQRSFFSGPALGRFVPMTGARLNDRVRNWFPLKDLKLILAASTERAMFSGFIFDVEGTLVDSVAQNLKSQQEALERFGIRCRTVRFSFILGWMEIRRSSLSCPRRKSQNGKRF